MNLLLIAVSLSMDAFACAILKGLAAKKINFKYIITIGLYFGGFQALMPYLGYKTGALFKDIFTYYDKYIVFFIFLFLGVNMILDSKEKDKELSSSINIKEMLLLAIATSIDAYVIGITFTFLNLNLYFSILTIGFITFIISSFGVIIGYKVGEKYNKSSAILGGILLIILALKNLFK